MKIYYYMILLKIRRAERHIEPITNKHLTSSSPAPNDETTSNLQPQNINSSLHKRTRPDKRREPLTNKTLHERNASTAPSPQPPSTGASSHRAIELLPPSERLRHQLVVEIAPKIV